VFSSSLISQLQIINFDLRKLPSLSPTSTITADDGNTTLTVATNDVWGATGQAGIQTDPFDGLRIYRRETSSLTFSFSKSVTLQSYFIDYVLSINGHSINFSFGSENDTLELLDNNNTTNEFSSKIKSWVIPKNTTITLTTVAHADYADQNWSSLTVAVVPEPASFAILLGCTVFGFMFMIRRRTQKGRLK
jgi:hypothetical protein